MVSNDILISLVPVLPFLGFLIVSLNVKKLSQGVTAVIACGVVLISFLIAVYLFIRLVGKSEEERFFAVTLFDWINAGTFSAKIGFLVDPLSSLMLLIITG